jgi:hypothetical protein
LATNGINRWIRSGSAIDYGNRVACEHNPRAIDGAAKTALFSVGRAVGGNEEVVEFVELVIELA